MIYVLIGMVLAYAKLMTYEDKYPHLTKRGKYYLVIPDLAPWYVVIILLKSIIEKLNV